MGKLNAFEPDLFDQKYKLQTAYKFHRFSSVEDCRSPKDHEGRIATRKGRIAGRFQSRKEKRKKENF